jgi:threonine dehydratase
VSDIPAVTPSILPTPREVREAAERIADSVRRTSLRPSPALSAIVGGAVHLKLETEQHGGSFKLRGALNAMLMLTDDERAGGVVAASAGNHGIGIALAAEQLGVRATVFVPFNAPVVKRAAIAAIGAKVDATQPGYDAAERAARAFARETLATFISPCTGRTLLAGQGTVGLEILTDLPDVGTIVVCVGGGGLCGGIGGYVRGTAPGVRILGAQSVRTNAMALALDQGHAVSIPDLPTLADGLAGAVDEEGYEQGKASLDAIATVEEEEIAAAMEWLLREEGVTAEGAGAVGVAALMSGRLKPANFPVAVTVTGRNRRQ